MLAMADMMSEAEESKPQLSRSQMVDSKRSGGKAHMEGSSSPGPPRSM